MTSPEWLLAYRQRSDAALSRRLAAIESVAPRLVEAMAYAALGAGKRVRPALVYAAAHAVAEAVPAIDAVACAVECMHSYSLVHDDLPAMDDDALRRGRPTCHVAFDEATAVLAGDALQSLAFQLIAEEEEISAGTRVELLRELALASGSSGMVAGQAIDMAAVAKSLSLPELEQMHRYKTGALIRASVRMGALATEASTAAVLESLERYAACIGLAFQVQDDILDVVGNTKELGKQQGADAERSKPTYVSLLGLDEAHRKAAQLHDQALEALAGFDRRADQLRELSSYIVSRSS